MAPLSLLASWLAALIALPLSLFTAATGQGLGAMAAGGGWIGLSAPWDRQAWALVNQPVLNFASLESAGGYWLGSLAAPLLVATLAIPLSLRLKSLTTQLFVVQWAWMASIIGVAWQGALDPDLSHLSRWLRFRNLPPELRWLAAFVAAAVAVPVVLRLISLARIARHHMSRNRRLALVLLHFVPVPLAWAATTSIVRGEIEIEAGIGAGVTILAVFAVAWIGYPAALTHAVTRVPGHVMTPLIAVCVVIWAAFWLAGRPLPDGRAAAVQWGRAGSYNNIRPWMEPLQAPWLTSNTINRGAFR